MIEITDTTLCGIPLNQQNALKASALYELLLDLGADYVQIPADALPLLAEVIRPERTVLEGFAGDACGALERFAGYVTNCPVSPLPGRLIVEAKIDLAEPGFADEIRWTADATLFMQAYDCIFGRLAGGRPSGLCVRAGGVYGTALLAEWVLAGGRKLTASFMGAGGYSPLEEILAALHVTGRLREGIRLDRLSCMGEIYRSIVGCTIPPHQPVIGDDIFHVESGVHVDGMSKDRRCYEPFAPEVVGARRRIVIGKHSGMHALSIKLKELGFRAEIDLSELLAIVRKESIDKGRQIYDGELLQMAKQIKDGNG